MGLASEMKNLSEELLSSFKQRMMENEELVNDVQKTLDGFRKDHQEMAAVLNANANALRKDLAMGERERLNAFHHLMSGIHLSISSIQTEVVNIQSSTFNMINEFATERSQMADELKKYFSESRAERMHDEKDRLIEFDALMKDINDEIKSINDEVLSIFKNTSEMLENFEKEHQHMSAELRAELSSNLAERVDYTRTLLTGFQKRLSDISRENQKAAQKLRKDLAKGEATRMSDYNGLMKGIHSSVKAIQQEVKDLQKATSGMIGDLSADRAQATAEWNKMQDAIARIRKSGVVTAPKVAAKKAEKKEAVVEAPAETFTVAPVQAVVAPPLKEEPKTLEQKVLEYINTHPMGVKVSEMEETLGETRMKLGYTAKTLLEEGKVQKNDNLYFPVK